MAARELPRLTGEALWVYPTARKARAALRERLAHQSVVVGRQATTFPELTEALAIDLGITRRVLSRPMAAIVAERVVRRSGMPLARQPGLVQEVQDTIEELKSAALGPGDLRAVATGLEGSEAATRVRELAGLYEGYEQGLRRLGALDRPGREWAVADGLSECVERGTRPRLLAGIRRVVFAEIYDFSVLQFLIATSIIRLVGDAELIAFAHPENVDATRFLDRTWNRFVATEAIAEQVLPSFVVRGGRPGSLGVVLRDLFTHEETTPTPADSTLQLVIAPHRYAEVEAVVRDIRRRLQNDRTPLARIGIIARDMTVYRDLVSDVCGRFGVPVRLGYGPAMLSAGCMRMVVELLRCANEHLPRERLQALAESDYFGARCEGAGRILRTAAYVSEDVQPLEARLALVRESDGSLRQIERLTAFAGHVRRLRGRRRLPSHVATLRRVLRALRFAPVRHVHDAPTAAQRDALAWRQLTDVLSGLAGLDRAVGGEAMECTEFLALVLSATAEQPLGDGQGPRDGVQALSVMDARGMDFDVVYVVGLDDGTFPAPRREGVLLPDWLKREVNPVAAEVLRRRLGPRAQGLALGGLLRSAREGRLEDPFLFFLALSMSEREVVLSHPAADERGNPTVRSPFVEEVERLLTGGLPTTEVHAADGVPTPERCATVLELITRAARDRWHGTVGEPAGLAAALRETVPAADARLDDIDRRAYAEAGRTAYFLSPARAAAQREALAGPYVGRIVPERSLTERLDALVWTPTRLERLGECGFKFFMQDVLKVGERDAAELDLGPRERGTLAHAVVEAFFDRHAVLPGDLTQARALGEAFLARERGQFDDALGGSDDAFAGIGWQQIEHMLDELIVLEHDRQTSRPVGEEVERWLEWKFETTLPAAVAGRRLRIAGKVDRVDVHRRDGEVTEIRVIDYKTVRGRSGYAKRMVLTDDGVPAFQIPLYLQGVLQAGATPIPSTATLAGEYLLLLAPPSQKRVDAVIDAETLLAMTARAGELVDAVHGGRFDVEPRRCDPSCAYRGVCRYRRPPTEEGDRA